MFAIIGNHLEVVQTLVANYADMDVRDYCGFSALHYAVEKVLGFLLSFSVIVTVFIFICKFIFHLFLLFRPIQTTYFLT
jgi:hypothetical protein